MLARRPVSQLQIFRVLLGLRWLILVLLPVQEALGTDPAARTATWVGIGFATVYMALLSAFSRRVLAFHRTSSLFATLDMAVAFGLYLTGSGASWPFFLFSTTTILIAGLNGTIGAAIAAALAWNGLTFTGQWVRGISPQQVFAITAIEDVFNLVMIAALWAYAVGLVGRLSTAYDELRDSRDALAQANASLDDREKEILGLLDVGVAILGKLDRDEILAIVIDALSGMGFGRCRLWLLEEGIFRCVFPSGEELPDLAGESSSPLTQAVRQREPVTAEPQATEQVPGVDPGTLSIVIPVVAEDEPLGALVVESIHGLPFDEDEIEMLDLFSDQIALALQHLHFYDQTREHAVSDERVRITSEIRDTVVQKVSGASLVAESLCKEDVPADVADLLTRLRQTIRAGLRDLRFAVLNWDSLEWQGSPAGLAERYTSEFATLSGVSVSVTCRGDEQRLGVSKAKDLLRVLQGALSNVWRHAHATAAQVDLAFDARGVTMTVRDDGRGFDLAGVVPRDGVGLEDMRCRATRNRGTIDVTSAPGDGTQVRIWLPR